MRLKILGSSSKGNCYILENGKEVLIIECGVKIYDIKKALDFQLAHVSGCLVTHEHGDHAKSINEVLLTGIPVYTSRGTMRALGLNVNINNLHTIKAGEMFKAGNFSVIPFDVQHDVVEPLGFIINHKETGSILFITDSYYVKYPFKNINNILIEANYSDAILKDRMSNGYMPDYRTNRLIKSHMSLETCKMMLKSTDLSKVHNIVLIHLSDGNSNAIEFQKDVQAATGKKVHVADEGIIIENFNKTPF